MAETLRDVMTRDPVTLDASSSIEDAARAMRERDIGAVLVVESGTLYGILTDRDIVVRALALGRDPKSTKVSEVASRQIESLPASASIQEAVDLMMDRSLRRIPVVEYDRPVGIVSIGDLAVDRDSRSVLGQISAEDANR